MNEKFAHTPGKLNIDPAETSGCSYLLDESMRFAVARVMAYENDSSKGESNARRLAACWNACDGIPIEVLEAGMAGGLPWSVPDQIEKMIEHDEIMTVLQACRDELFAMIERHNHPDDQDGAWMYDYQTIVEADAILSKATGKTSEAA